MPDRELPPFPDEGRPASARKLATATQISHLGALPIFANCSKKELRHLTTATRSELIEAGQVVFEEGQPSREAYMIVAGTALVRSGDRHIAELGPGEFFGEMGLLLHRGHSASVVAVTPLELLVLPQEGLRVAIDEVPGLGWTLLTTFADRIAENSTLGLGPS